MMIIDRPLSGARCRRTAWLRAVVYIFAIASCVVAPLTVWGQNSNAEDTYPRAKDGILLRDFRPKAMLQGPVTRPAKARFPVVDVHTHFRFKLRGPLEDYVALMDRQGIAVCVSLDGKLGDDWQDHADLLWTKYRERFVIFVFIDWLGDGQRELPETWDCHRPDFGRRIASQLADAKARGASGVKIFKSLGLEVPGTDGGLARIDDPRWDAIWQACGALDLPVLIHSADPAAFFEPVDAQNERWEELQRHPDWSFHDPKYPRHQELLAARNRVIAKHPQTTFIGAHVANNPEDLAQVGRWLDAYPNLYVDIASRIGELGRQPRTARRFFEQYADRIMLGTDGPWPAARLGLYWRFLETEDEYFPYSEKEFPPQGFWQIYGLGLPEDVLRQVYYGNAARIIPGVEARVGPACRAGPES